MRTQFFYSKVINAANWYGMLVAYFKAISMASLLQIKSVSEAFLSGRKKCNPEKSYQLQSPTIKGHKQPSFLKDTTC